MVSPEQLATSRQWEEDAEHRSLVDSSDLLFFFFILVGYVEERPW